MKTLLCGFGMLALLAAGCGTLDGAEALIEEATYSAALSEGDGEALDGSLVDEVDLSAAADEEADVAVDVESELSGDCSLEGLRARVMARYDANGNGKLERAEREQLAEELGPAPRLRFRLMRHYRLQRLKWVYDADENGYLDEAERAQLRQDLEARCQNRHQALLSNFDADGSGQLDAAEWAAAQEALQERIQARVQAVLAEFDLNGNGMLDVAERAALVQARQQQMLQIRTELKQQFDADGDGALSEQERAQLREFLRSRVRGEHFGAEQV